MELKTLKDLTGLYDVCAGTPEDILREEAIKWAAEITALQQGKTIQFTNTFGSWVDFDDPLFKRHGNYRIKPKPESRRVSLGPEDVPPGSGVRRANDATWRAVLAVWSTGIQVIAFENLTLLTFNLLRSEDWRISRDGGKTWLPCWKEVAE